MMRITILLATLCVVYVSSLPFPDPSDPDALSILADAALNPNTDRHSMYSEPVVEASENEASKERQPPVSPGVSIQAIQNEETRPQNPNKRPRPDDDDGGDGEDLHGANPGPSNKKLRFNTAAASLNSANEEPSLSSPVESVASSATLMRDSRQNTPDSAPEHNAYDSESSASRSAKDPTLGVKCWYKLNGKNKVVVFTVEIPNPDPQDTTRGDPPGRHNPDPWFGDSDGTKLRLLVKSAFPSTKPFSSKLIALPHIHALKWEVHTNDGGSEKRIAYVIKEFERYVNEVNDGPREVTCTEGGPEPSYTEKVMENPKFRKHFEKVLNKKPVWLTGDPAEVPTLGVTCSTKRPKDEHEPFELSVHIPQYDFSRNPWAGKIQSKQYAKGNKLQTQLEKTFMRSDRRFFVSEDWDKTKSSCWKWQIEITDCHELDCMANAIEILEKVINGLKDGPREVECYDEKVKIPDYASKAREIYKKGYKDDDLAEIVANLPLLATAEDFKKIPSHVIEID